MKEMKIKVLDWSGNCSDLKPIGIYGQSSSSALVVKTVQQKQSSPSSALVVKTVQQKQSPSRR